MARGGARNRSGPPVDPDSGRSDRRGVVLTALPAEGYQGEPPEYPLPPFVVKMWVYEGTARWQQLDEEGTARFRARELELWAWAWSTPQAAAWSVQRWRWPNVAMWVRTFVVCEGSDATAADKGALHRFADQIGMTPAGLKENGWKIAEDELAAHAQAKPEPSKPRKSARERMTVVPDAESS